MTVTDIEEILSAEEAKRQALDVKKHLDLEFDLGTLLASDINELDKKDLKSRQNDYLLDLARDNTQLLINQIWELPTERIEEAIVVKLPSQKYKLPRSLPVPKPKPLTKWQQFAKEKGITKKKKAKLSWDDQLKKWVPLFGYKKKQADQDKDWVIEVPQNADPLEDQFEKKKLAKGEKIAKNELQRLRNIAKAKNIKVPRFGLANPDVSSSKELQTAVTVAKASTASLGKFQSKLPQEKEARGVAAITPGASRKRKPPPVSGTQERSENLEIVNAVLNKRPKLDIEKAVARQINNEQLQRSEQKQNERPKGKGKKSVKSKNSKKPSGGKRGKAGKGGRKRR